MDFKYSPPEDQLLLWLRAEKAGDSGDVMTERILGRVLRSKGYTQTFKARVKFDRACYLYSRGRTSLSLEPQRAVELLSESILLHIEALHEFISVDSSMVSKSQEFSRNTCLVLAQHFQASGHPDEFLRIAKEIGQAENKISFDPLVEAIEAFMRWGLLGIPKKDALQRRLNRFENLADTLAKLNIWSETERKTELNGLKVVIKELYRKRMASLRT